MGKIEIERDRDGASGSTHTQFHFNQWNSTQTIWRFMHTLYADVYMKTDVCIHAYVFACMRTDFIALYHFCLLKHQAPTKQRLLSAHNKPKQQRLMITVCSYKSTSFGCERLWNRHKCIYKYWKNIHHLVKLMCISLLSFSNFGFQSKNRAKQQQLLCSGSANRPNTDCELEFIVDYNRSKSKLKNQMLDLFSVSLSLHLIG